MASDQIYRNADQYEKEETIEATASTKNFQNEVRQWFTAMSPEERAAVLGFEDESLIVSALLSRIAGPSSSTTGSHDNIPDQQRNISRQRPAPTSALPPKRTTDELLFSNETFDWEANVAIEIIEKTWEEIMMVGVPNTSGVNQKDFVKNTMHHKDEENNGKAPLGAPTNPAGSIGNGSSNALETKAEEKTEQKVNCDESTKSDHANTTDVVSDAYRIQNEGVDAVGKAASATAQETEDTTVLESCQPRDKGEKGNANGDLDEPTTTSSTNPPDFATTAINTTSSPSAMHGIEAGLRYPSENHNSRRIVEVMDNTRCIFPAASKIISTATNGDHTTSNELLQQKQKHPFITINPSYLESVTGDELLVAFDEIMAMAYTDSSSDEPCSFILPEEATSASWIDLVRSYATTDTSSPSQYIPLYILILCRFQYSLAKAYSERTPSQGSSNEQANNDQLSISVESTAQWLSALTTRIRELEKSNSPEIQKVLADLASKFPAAGESGDGERGGKNRNLEDYLLLPFSVVARRLGKILEQDSRVNEALEKIDMGIEKSIQGSSLLTKESAATENDQAGNGIGPEGNNLILEGDDQIIPNGSANTASNGGKKGKKKKKKKKRKGSAAAAKAKAEESAAATKADETGGPEENRNAAEASAEIATEPTVDGKENNSVISESQVDSEVPVTEVEQQISADVVPETDAKSTPKANYEEENVAKEAPKVPESDFQNSADLSTTDAAASAVHLQPKPSTEEVAESKKDSAPKETENNEEDDNDDQWETVEIRPRGRKKTSDKGNSARSQHAGNNGSSNSQHGGNKKKAPRTKETRARTKHRKMVREILGGVLDSVEETIRKRRAVSRERVNALRSQTQSPPLNSSSTTAASQNSTAQKNSGSSLRDILLRGKEGNQSQQSKTHNATKAAPLSYSERARSLMASDSNSISRRKNEKQTQITGSKTSKALKAARALPADQSTIPTIASTTSAFTPSVSNVTSRKFGAALSSDSSDSESAEDKKLKNTLSDPIKFASPSPPLPTLLSPGNNNSTSSSVASSLDAPHAGHHGNKSRQSENDVGCHLLDICDRLSSEIDVFMKRREVALAVRRHERGLVLAALEKTLGLIWPGTPSVEMYGSCATNLDLPSSDLDVVVCGLEKPFVDIATSPSNASSVVSDVTGDSSPIESKNDKKNASPDSESRKDGSTLSPDQRYSRHQMSQYQMQMMYGHMSVNAERVLRLAMELEHQPWAVHVKAIPTASVPVIKILADPARLEGADWLVQQPINGQSPASLNSHNFSENQQSSPLWRGADVVNGLLKVDITFEGPEHGGIGSTKFSQKVVEDFSIETGLAPESTPQVQVLMVLKELLAQRRSNEPFSGGLSSYALLLLVISMIGERSIIREELEKTERQRRVMAAGGGNSALRSTAAELVDSTSKDSKQSKEATQSKTASQAKADGSHSSATKATGQSQNGTTNNAVKGNDTAKTTAWQGRQDKSDQKKPSKSTPAVVPPPVQKKAPAPSSWASIARSRAPSTDLTKSKKKKDTQEKDKPDSKKESAAPDVKEPKAPSKPSSFADAVAKGKPMQVPNVNATPKKVQPAKKSDAKKRFDGLLDPQQPKTAKPKAEKEDSKNTNVQQTKGNAASTEETKAAENNISSASNHSKTGAAPVPESNVNNSLDSSGFPQGFHDVIEVLCSGETTPGKLLMHFLLFYGQHFESQSTAIDYSGTHTRDAGANNGYSVRSAYMLRRNTGSYDPVTGMYTVDPIVIYDPLEGAENNNVARSCFAWSSIRWVFAQSYMTLSSAAEQNASDGTRKRSSSTASEGPSYGHDESGNVVVDPSSPLLELLLSY